MNRALILPATVAFSAHALLLFGFSRRPAPPHLIKDLPAATGCIEVTRYEDPPPPEDMASGPSAGKETPAPPSGEEPLPSAVPRDAIAMDAPRAPTTIDRDARVIEGGPIGFEGLDAKTLSSIQIVDASHLDGEPRARFQPPPQYPYAMKNSGVDGNVLVEFVVDETGRVMNPRVVRSSHLEFEDSAVRAVAKWRFEPGMHNGRAVRFRMSVPIVFHLNE
jgi:protein TonB